MNRLPEIFKHQFDPEELPVASIYISWDWSKPSASNRERLTDEIKVARALLKQKLSDSEIQSFLAPIWNVTSRLRDPLPDLAGLAIFRTKNDFWFVQMTHDPGTFTVISDTFHIKPLLISLQDPKRFAVLWFHEKGATLAYGSERQMVCLESVVSSLPEKENRDFYLEIKKMVNEKIKDPRVELILAGEASAIGKARQYRIFNKIADVEIQGFASRLSMSSLEGEIRALIRDHRKNSERELLRELLREIKWSGYELVTEIDQVAKLAAKGQIKTLVVAKDQKLFGKLNRKNGDMSISGAQADCSDDDLYDDLAECVQNKGGKVLVISQKLIPGNTGVLAILETEQEKSLESMGVA